MAFPSNPSNGDTYLRYGRTYEYDSAMAMWKVKKSGIAIDDLDDVDITTVAPQSGDALQWNGTNFVPFNTAKLISYATIAELPLVGAASGQMAYVQENGRLYIFNGAGWFSVALVNIAPTITTGPDASYVFATDGTPIVLTLEAQDPEEVPISWSYQVSSGVLGSTATIVQDGNVFTITPSTNEADVGAFSITFIASDGVNLATAATSFTLAFGSADAYYTYNNILLKTNTSPTITQTIGNHTVALAASTYQSSFSPYRANWSVDLSEPYAYLKLDSSAGFAFGTGDFTIEFWFKSNFSDSLIRILYDSRSSADNSSQMPVIYLQGDKIKFLSAGTDRIVQDDTCDSGKWHHVAVCRVNGSTKLFINGTQKGSTYTDTNDYLIGASLRPYIGNDARVGGNYFNGSISNLRVIKGSGIYENNFNAPTTKLTKVTNTTFLGLQSNRLIDNSDSNVVIWKNTGNDGYPTITTDSPFEEKYDPSIHGGSSYTNSTTTGGVNITSLPSMTTDYCIEFWVYHNALAGTSNQSRMLQGLVGTNNPLIYYNGTSLVYLVNNSPVVTYSPNFNLGQKLREWIHIAISVVSGTHTFYINGVAGGTGSSSYPISDLVFGGCNAGGYTMNGYGSDFRVTVGSSPRTSNFTPPTSPSDATYATSHVPMNGTESTAYDEMGKNYIGLYGDTQATTARTKYNTSSLYFDGSGDYATIKVPAIGTGDFTIEGWVNFGNVIAGNYVFDFRDSVSTFRPALTLNPDWRYVSESAYVITSSVTPATNVWYHFAAVRSNGTTTLYINGSSLGSAADSRNYVGTNAGKFASYYGLTGNTNMYLEDFRITVGRARYTANFTPPTAPLGFDNAE